MPRAVISSIAHDRPGLVGDLSRLVHDAGLSIEDSRMTVLGGEFAVLVAVVGEDSGLDALEAALAAAAADGDQAVLFRRTGERTAPPARPYRVNVVAMDHPGIVAAVAGFFAERRINIRDLDTETRPAPHTGTPIFDLDLVVEVPADVRISELRDAFAAFCEDGDLDGELAPER